MGHPNADLLSSHLDAISRGDIAEAMSLYADDIVFHYPGRNSLSGEYRGKPAVLALMGKVDGSAVLLGWVPAMWSCSRMEPIRSWGVDPGDAVARDRDWLQGDCACALDNARYGADRDARVRSSSSQ